MSAEIITALLVGSLAAGWVDAVVGGGGLILIPLILVLNPSMAPAQALATNKVAAIFGTSSAAITLSRRVPSALHALKYAPLALVGSAAGALLAASVDKQVMRPVIIVLLVAVGVFTVARPSLGGSARVGWRDWGVRRRVWPGHGVVFDHGLCGAAGY